MNITRNNLPLNVMKYLEKYSSGNWNVECRENKLYKNIAVIPAIKEYSNIIKLIDSLSDCGPIYFNETLFLFVINNTINAPEEAIEDNRKSIGYLRSIINADKGSVPGKILNSGLNLAIVDASSGDKILPEKDGGVGLARKTGMDLALTLFNYGNSRKNILICLDADCTVQKNYLTEIVENYNKNNYSAAYVNFEHPLPETFENKLAIICYEIFLRYYVLGLIYARSGYAIHTIGSTMICDHESYIKAEGMNKKKAAEDFYFMEKLCKNYKVNKIAGTTIYPSSRGSWRVPFGTGQRVNRYLSKTQNEYLLYSPESFEILKKWLEVYNSEEKFSAKEYLDAAENIHPSLLNFLNENKFEENWNRIAENCKNDTQLAKQKHFWFDGFRTLKLIHYLRDNGFPQMEMYNAVEEMLSRFNSATGIEINEDIYSMPEKQYLFLDKLRQLA